jgi:hypothetical protein
MTMDQIGKKLIENSFNVPGCDVSWILTRHACELIAMAHKAGWDGGYSASFAAAGERAVAIVKDGVHTECRDYKVALFAARAAEGIAAMQEGGE